MRISDRRYLVYLVAFKSSKKIITDINLYVCAQLSKIVNSRWWITRQLIVKVYVKLREKFARRAIVRENSTASVKLLQFVVTAGHEITVAPRLLWTFAWHERETFSWNADKEAGKVCPSIEVRCMCTCQIATHNTRHGRETWSSDRSAPSTMKFLAHL